MQKDKTMCKQNESFTIISMLTIIIMCFGIYQRYINIVMVEKKKQYNYIACMFFQSKIYLLINKIKNFQHAHIIL